MTESGLKIQHHVDHVGSLLRPPTLMDIWHAHEAGDVDAEELQLHQDEAVRDVVRMQEDVGLQVVSDGEFRRAGWSRGFLAAVDAFDFAPSLLTFRDDQGLSTAAPAPVAHRTILRREPIVVEDFKFLDAISPQLVKVTMPSPSHMHFGHFSKAADASVYADMTEYWRDLTTVYQEEIADLADAGCELLQLDEVPLTLCCDDTNRGIASSAGEDPEQLINTYFDAIEEALRYKPENMAVQMHLCRGNMQGLWMGDGGYAPIAERLFNLKGVDAYLMEYDTPRAGDFAPLRFLPPGRKAFLGLVSTKNPEIEKVDDLRRKIDEAARYAEPAQLGLCPQCGFGSSALSKFNVKENPMTPDLQRRKLELLVTTAEAQWGHA